MSREGYAVSEECNDSRKTFPTIDLLYDYGNFLRNSNQQGRIGHFPHHIKPPKVAIVGCGLSGLIAAHELLRAGITDLTLYESRDRIGGKLWAHQFKLCPRIYAEMGGMRFPTSEACLFYYLQKHGLVRYSSFPNPGSVDTMLFYSGRSHFWQSGTEPPGIFRRVHRGWQELLKNGFVSEGVLLEGPLVITGHLKSGNLKQARSIWQKWLKHFGNESFSSGIEKIFTSDRAPGDDPWTVPDDIDLFKALGVGSGGFGPVFESGFIEILRLIVNGYETDVKLLLEGTSALSEKIASQSTGGVELRERVCFEQVSFIDKRESQIKLTLKHGRTECYDRVIVTTGLSIMQLRHRLTSNASLLSPQARRAVDHSHITGSSKLFILTETKFWLTENLPACVLTTGSAKQAYCLDYEPDDPKGHGLVLLSYTWESDSHKLLSITEKEERLEILRRDFEDVFPQFAAHLVPANGDYNDNVLQHDWLTDPHSGGAFKLNRRGEEALSRDLFFQPLSSLRSSQDSGLYLAGCGCSFTGGWAEGAVQTALNAACAVIHGSGGVLVHDNPLQHDWYRYEY